MKVSLNLNRESLKASYEENKDFFVPIAVIGIAIILIVIFILPAIFSFPSKKSERDTEMVKLNQIKQAKKILENIDSASLDTEVKIASQTLPSEKNFEIILNAISTAASSANVAVGGYVFSDEGEKTIASSKKIPSVSFEVDVSGDPLDAAKFVDELYKTYPLSEALAISYEDGVSKIKIDFYYKPFTSLSADQVSLARETTAQERKTLSEIANWTNTGNTESFDEVSTQSGSRSSSPF